MTNCNLTKDEVVAYLQQKSTGNGGYYWKLKYWLEDTNKKFSNTYFKGNKYLAVLKANNYLITHHEMSLIEPDELNMRDYGTQKYLTKFKCKCGQDCKPSNECCFNYPNYDTFEEAVEIYIADWFESNTIWLEKVEKPIIF